MSHPAIAILPAGSKPRLRPGQLGLDRLWWPMGQPGGLQGGRLRDLGPDDHLIVFLRDALQHPRGFGTPAKVSVILAEPRAIHGHLMQRLHRGAGRFHRILTYDPAVLHALSNAVFFPLGMTWVPDWRSRDTAKTRSCSLIASAKRSQEGHRLRHEIAARVQSQGLDVDLLGLGYSPFKDKADGLAPYRYSIVIENVREANYFSEKLIDSLLLQTVPIYWGCPNIGDFIDESAMIVCNSARDIMQAVAAASPGDYAARLPALRAAHGQAEHWADWQTRAARSVLDETPVPAPQAMGGQIP
ncbi:glycosyltransferase family 10 domain-containing protein [Roseovarius salinarum]|uniref:glycosyltransferase family 10 domain-containing protein n=1 Tax=Roseovarius salinarum TaxID=1981892 RepID=UPI000C334C3D|nr:glycosyltransferase family 10 [Roseovarius salinarum]